MPGIAAEKAPIVQFEWMEYGIDQAASERAGRPIPKTVPFACVQPDKFTRLEYPADEFLEGKRKAAIEGRFNPEWVARWQAQYDAWKKGEELPIEGQPVKTWAALNKEQVARLIALGYPTIEQVAGVTDTTLAVIGLDGRYLRDLARKALEQHANGGALTIEVANLKQSLRDKDDQIERMQQRLAALEKAQTEPEGEVRRGPGRPKGS